MWIAGRLWVFVVLLLLSLLVLVAFVDVALNNQELQGQLLAILLFLGVLWWAYTKLPSPIRRGIGGLIGRKKGDGKQGHR
jgi:hypothetical protein